MTSATAEISASVLRALSRVKTDSSVRSGRIPEKILTCLTCPAMTASRRRPARLQNLDALAKLAERHPVEVGASPRAPPRSRSGNASSLIATTVTSWPRLRAPRSDEEGKPAVAGDEADSAHATRKQAVYQVVMQQSRPRRPSSLDVTFVISRRHRRTLARRVYDVSIEEQRGTSCCEATPSPITLISRRGNAPFDSRYPAARARRRRRRLRRQQRHADDPTTPTTTPDADHDRDVHRNLEQERRGRPTRSPPPPAAPSRRRSQHWPRTRPYRSA